MQLNYRNIITTTQNLVHILHLYAPPLKITTTPYKQKLEYQRDNNIPNTSANNSHLFSGGYKIEEDAVNFSSKKEKHHLRSYGNCYDRENSRRNGNLVQTRI